MVLPKQLENFPGWYNRVVLESGLAENASVRGCMIIKPYGYALWENIQQQLDRMIKLAGIDNAYFPLLIPESFLQKEAEHVKGFAPEVAVITQAGGKELDERYVIRPTSETVMYDTFSRWIESYRDLPLKINQWANVMRWEMRTRLFLRTSEFLWQEGHTVHETKEEAEAEMLRALSMYEEFARDYLAIAVVIGEKSFRERFAGADKTVAIEALMRDGKALQMGTSHNLGQNFAQSFGIKFLDRNNKEKYPWQTSWGVSTRLIGGIIMSHGDDKGLIIPPKVAPIQVVIVPIYKNDTDQKRVINFVNSHLLKKLDGIRAKLDERDNLTPGFKFNEWELKGVPLRIEIGSRDLEKNEAVVVNRLSLDKQSIKLQQLGNYIKDSLEKFHQDLLQRSESFTSANTYNVGSLAEIDKLIQAGKFGFYRAGWCGRDECEQEIQTTKYTIRVLPFSDNSKTKCVVCKKNGRAVIIAKAY